MGWSSSSSRKSVQTSGSGTCRPPNTSFSLSFVEVTPQGWVIASGDERGATLYFPDEVRFREGVCFPNIAPGSVAFEPDGALFVCAH